MANKHLKNCSTAQMIRKGRTTMTNHMVPTVAVMEIKGVTKADENENKERETGI